MTIRSRTRLVLVQMQSYGTSQRILWCTLRVAIDGPGPSGSSRTYNRIF